MFFTFCNVFIWSKGRLQKDISENQKINMLYYNINTLGPQIEIFKLIYFPDCFNERQLLGKKIEIYINFRCKQS